MDNLPIQLVPQLALAVWALGWIHGRRPRGAQPLRERLRALRAFAVAGLLLAFLAVPLGETVRLLPAPLSGYLLLLFAAWSASRTEFADRPLLGRRFLAPLALAGALDTLSWLGLWPEQLSTTAAAFAELWRIVFAFGVAGGMRRLYLAAGWGHHALLARSLPYLMCLALLFDLSLPGDYALPFGKGGLGSLPPGVGLAAWAARAGAEVGPPLLAFFLTWRLRAELVGEIHLEQVRSALEGVPVKDRAARQQALSALETEPPESSNGALAPRWLTGAVVLWSVLCMGSCLASSLLVNQAQHAQWPGGYRVIAVPWDPQAGARCVDDRERFREATGAFLHTQPAREAWLAAHPSYEVLVVVLEGEREVLCGRFQVGEGGPRWIPSEDLTALNQWLGFELQSTRQRRLDANFPRRSAGMALLGFAEGNRPRFDRMLSEVSAADGLLLVELAGASDIVYGVVRVRRERGELKAEASVETREELRDVLAPRRRRRW